MNAVVSPESRISAIIPAHNEAPRLGAVLKIISAYPHFIEVIVVDDGSTDRTGQIAQQFPIIYLRNSVNLGKGAALDRAVAQAQGNILFFCDADVQGLTHDTIHAVLAPVLNQTKELSIAMRYHYTLQTWPWLMPFILLLGGERALTKKLWQLVPAHYKHQFRIESALNFYAKHEGLGLTYALFPHLRQPTKDKKRGLVIGNLQRFFFIAQILTTEVRLRLVFLIKRLRPIWSNPLR